MKGTRDLWGPQRERERERERERALRRSIIEKLTAERN
jgi:hypothetical protein